MFKLLNSVHVGPKDAWQTDAPVLKRSDTKIIFTKIKTEGVTYNIDQSMAFTLEFREQGFAT